MSKIYRKILAWMIALAVIQLCRIGFKLAVFQIIDRTPTGDSVVSGIYMIMVSVILILYIRKKGIDIRFLPSDFNKWYIFLSCIVMLVMFTGIFVFGNNSLPDILSFFYNAVVTVFFEETLFRGFLYWDIASVSNEITAYIVSTILFALWHFGYVDSVIYRTSIFRPDADIPKIMIMKAITALIIGMILGFLRYKKKNMYPSVLLHVLINSLG